MATLKASFRDIAETSLMSCLRGRVPERDIQFALQTGISPLDVQLLRTSFPRHLIIVRCPKRAGLVLQGVLDPKPQGLAGKTSQDSATMQLADGSLVVSDIDLLSIWRGAGARWEKVFTPGPPKGGGWWGSSEAQRLMDHLLPRMQAPFDHGCNDDYHSAGNQGLSPTGTYAAFFHEQARLLPSLAAVRAFYEQQGLQAPYDAAGKYTGPVAAKA